jgi:hypothetical protein
MFGTITIGYTIGFFEVLIIINFPCLLPFQAEQKLLFNIGIQPYGNRFAINLSSGNRITSATGNHQCLAAG